MTLVEVIVYLRSSPANAHSSPRWEFISPSGSKSASDNWITLALAKGAKLAPKNGPPSGYSASAICTTVTL